MATSEAGGEARARIGARLRSAREARGLTTLQAAEKLHVDPRILEALEAENFAALGATVYVRGHLRHYAELIGESPAELQSMYSAAAPAPDLTRIPHRAPQSRSSRLLALALLVLVGVAVAGVVWWLLTLPAAKPQPVSAEQPAVAPPGTASAAQLMSAIADAQARGAGGARGASGETQLALRFSEVSWVQVYDGAGRRLFEGLIAPNSARTLSGAPPLKVVLGNAPGVAVRVNGQKVALDGLVHRDGSARFLLDGNGHAAPMPPLVAHGG
jgi:cytoskeleton protein RodZ